jgi:putative membrane protein
LQSSSVFADTRGYGEGYGMGPWMMNWGHGFGWVFPLVMFIFFITFVVGIVFLIRWIVLSTKITGTKSDESALEILKKRYAKGEISKEEFEEKKKDIL